MVNDDFGLVCVDLVQRPSANTAYVELAESLAWSYDEDAQIYVQAQIKDLLETSTKRTTTSSDLRNSFLNIVDALAKTL